MKKGDHNKPVTRGLLDDAVDAIMKGMDGILSEQGKHFNILEAGQKNLQRQISDLKYDTPTKKEFKELKGKIDKYHPVV